MGDGGDLVAQPFFEGRVEVALEHALGRACGHGRPEGDLGGGFAGGGHQLVVRDAAVEQADVERFIGLDEAAGEDEFGGAGVADDAWQEPGHAGVGRERALEEDGLEAGFFGADADVAGEREAHAGAGGDAVDGGDGGLVDCAEGEGLRADPAEFVEPRALAVGDAVLGGARGEVCAGAEAAPCAGDDQHAHVVVGAQLVGGGDHFVVQVAREGVELLGAIQRDRRDPVGDLNSQVLIRHSGSFRSLA